MTPKYRIFFEFQGPDGEDEVEAESLDEANNIAKEMALERLSYGADELCPDCGAVIVPGCKCDECGINE